MWPRPRARLVHVAMARASAASTLGPPCSHGIACHTPCKGGACAERDVSVPADYKGLAMRISPSRGGAFFRTRVVDRRFVTTVADRSSDFREVTYLAPCVSINRIGAQRLAIARACAAR